MTPSLHDSSRSKKAKKASVQKILSKKREKLKRSREQNEENDGILDESDWISDTQSELSETQIGNFIQDEARKFKQSSKVPQSEKTTVPKISESQEQSRSQSGMEKRASQAFKGFKLQEKFDVKASQKSIKVEEQQYLNSRPKIQPKKLKEPKKMKVNKTKEFKEAFIDKLDYQKTRNSQEDKVQLGKRRANRRSQLKRKTSNEAELFQDNVLEADEKGDKGFSLSFSNHVVDDSEEEDADFCLKKLHKKKLEAFTSPEQEKLNCQNKVDQNVSNPGQNKKNRDELSGDNRISRHSLLSSVGSNNIQNGKTTPFEHPPALIPSKIHPTKAYFKAANKKNKNDSPKINFKEKFINSQFINRKLSQANQHLIFNLEMKDREIEFLRSQIAIYGQKLDQISSTSGMSVNEDLGVTRKL